jgi:hypothetical protein
MKSFLTAIFLLTTSLVFSKDKGIGLLYVSSDLKGKVQINIYEKNNVESRLLGLFISQQLEEGQTTYSIQERNIKTDNLIEFEYEKQGLPLCGIRDNWVNVIYGYDKSGKALTGWIEQKSGTTDYFIWKDYLKSVMLFFESADQIKFFDKPDGARVEFKLQPSQNLKYDYIMKPVELNGSWMKVEVTTPSNYCDTPETKETRVFWIKYLDQNGRPLVWYFTRGC